MFMHITDSNSRRAAREVRSILATKDRPWIVWSVGADGFCMAPSDSRQAEVIRQYWRESIAGEYRKVTLDQLTADLSAARKEQVSRSDNRTPQRRAYGAMKKRESRARAAA